MTKILFPGSFDPLTKGHLDLIERASKMFDEVVVAVLVNVNKTSMLSTNEKLDILKQETASFQNVSCLSSESLTVKLAKDCGAHAILRGVRNIRDFEYEMDIASANRYLNPTIETILLYTKPEYSFISSSVIREMLLYGQDIRGFVGEYTAQVLYKTMENKNRG